MKNGTLIGTLGMLAVLAIVYFSMSVSYKNQEVTIREAAKAKQETNKAGFDMAWKVINQTGQVAKQYKNDFQDVYTDIMDSRYQKNPNAASANVENNAMLFSFMKEHNPEFSPDLHKKVSNAIQAQRANFYHMQEELQALKQEHSTLIKTFPGSFFLSSIEELDITIITSTKTEQIFESGKEDDVKVF